jgi:hypothetical protein
MPAVIREKSAMMEKIFHFAESHQNVDRFISRLGWGAVSLGAVAAVVLVVAFTLK